MEYHIAIKHFHFKENSVWKNLVLREKSGFSMCMHCSSNSYKNVYLYIQKKKHWERNKYAKVKWK